MRHWHVEHPADARQAIAEKPAHQRDPGIRLAHAFGDEHLVARVILAEHPGFHRAFDRRDQFRRADGRNHVAGDRALGVSGGNGGDLDHVAGEQEEIERRGDGGPEFFTKLAVGAAEGGKNDAGPAGGVGGSRRPGAEVGAA